MKKILFLFVVLLLLNSCSQFYNGYIDKNVYYNTYFNFSVIIPGNFKITDRKYLIEDAQNEYKETKSELKALEKKNSKNYWSYTQSIGYVVRTPMFEITHTNEDGVVLNYLRISYINQTNVPDIKSPWSMANKLVRHSEFTIDKDFADNLEIDNIDLSSVGRDMVCKSLMYKPDGSYYGIYVQYYKNGIMIINTYSFDIIYKQKIDEFIKGFKYLTTAST